MKIDKAIELEVGKHYIIEINKLQVKGSDLEQFIHSLTDAGITPHIIFTYSGEAVRVVPQEKLDE